MEKKRIVELINMFRNIHIVEEDVTTDEEKLSGQLVLVVTYNFEGKEFKTQKLYYQNIANIEGISHKNEVLKYFESPVYWLDIKKHDWPQPSGESDLDEIVIPEIAFPNDHEFITFLIKLANNQQDGWIQEITNEGRSGQYHHNLENNNHWHDLINLIKAYINSGGQEVEKKYFSRLVFRWDGNKNTERERATLSDGPYGGKRELIQELKRNIMIVHNELTKNKIINLLQTKYQVILQGPPGTGKTYTAKDIAYELIFKESISLDMAERKEQLKQLELSDQYNLIQFHPAYSYEDFVRGITAESKGSGIEYKTKNKILAEFANRANKNYVDSKKDKQAISNEKWVEEMFQEFKEHIQDEIDEKGKYIISKSAYLSEVEDDSFRYKGDNWSTLFRMPYSEIINLYNLGINERKEIKKNEKIKGRTKQHATYFFNLLSKFKDFLGGKKRVLIEKVSIEERKYILIIDEINRANLPAVLGELIYGLEYRGDQVKSMYDIEGDRTIVLPKNLYIIGTMNTADRSVGHIDYAIRRRFAFIDILPSDQVLDEMKGDVILKEKAKNLFHGVSSLFEREYLASDFQRKEVQLGHSYFMAESLEKLELKLEYEIKPILREYLKDGILLENAQNIIEELR